MNRYDIGSPLGEGAFGAVRQATYKETGEQVRTSHFIFAPPFFEVTYPGSPLGSMHSFLACCFFSQVAIKTLKDKCKDFNTMMSMPEVKVCSEAVPIILPSRGICSMF